MVHEGHSLLLLTVLLAVAASLDVVRRRIPNAVAIAIAAAGIAAQLAGGGPRAAGSGVVAALGIGAVLAPFWLRGGIGGGDLKLGAAAAVWVGLPRAPHYLLASALAGAILAIACYALSSRAARASIRSNLRALHAPAWREAAASVESPRLVPYGLAFAAGAFYVLVPGASP